MANFLPNSYRNGAVRYALNFDASTATLRACFIDNATTTAAVTHDFYDDIATAAVPNGRASGVALSDKTFGTVAVGVFDATNTVFSSLSGNPCEQLAVYRDTGTDGTSDLMAVWDVTVTPNGGDVTVVWNASGMWSF